VREIPLPSKQSTPAAVARYAHAYYADYGITSTYGWEIDHIKPVAKRGGDEITNLQPLQWENNRRKGDDYPNLCPERS
jgi:5-methylcytosine-specific restriction endonuclease McrA